MNIQLIDTHSHLDGEEFADDLQDVIQRATDAGVNRIFVPGINLKSISSVQSICQQYPDRLFPMLGLHPEDVREDYKEVLATMRSELQKATGGVPYIAIGEVGQDYYWSREFETEQREAFEEQVRWSVETRLPLMIHCRKAQNDLVRILKRYADDLPGGVFHCFTGNEIEARELLQFPNFVLGIGGVLTFKKSPLPEMLPRVVPLNRIVLETDSPYMAPVPYRGRRNESAYVLEVARKLAEAYGVTLEEVARTTTHTAEKLFLRSSH